MSAAATDGTVGNTNAGVLHLALELGRTQWKLGFTTGLGQRARNKSIRGADTETLRHEIALAKRRFGLPETARVVSCYEAGPEGFWVHRWLVANGVENVVVDSASIQVDRRKRRAKSDGLDVEALLTLLCRHTMGEKKVWSVVRVPPPLIEDLRQLHRELATLTEERTRIRNRMRGLLAAQGATVTRWSTLREELATLRLWDGAALGAGLRQRLERELERLELVEQQRRALEQAMQAELAQPAEPGSLLAQMQRLVELRSIGPQGARILVLELFGWRAFRNRREVGGCTGLPPTPYQSGASCHEQGIDKAGNKWLRRVATQLAWSWVRWQPQSALTQWFHRRFAGGGRRQRRVGIVGVARKLVIALWRYGNGEEIAGALAGPGDRYVLKAA
jgi:transposase